MEVLGSLEACSLSPSRVGAPTPKQGNNDDTCVIPSMWLCFCVLVVFMFESRMNENNEVSVGTQRFEASRTFQQSGFAIVYVFLGPFRKRVRQHQSPVVQLKDGERTDMAGSSSQ
jgi:hypothetical protein